MSLKIKLKANERIIINGAVISSGNNSTEFLIESEANFLRDKDIMLQEDSNTPAGRIYFLIQAIYLEPVHKDRFYNDLLNAIADLQEATELLEIAEALSHVRYFVNNNEYYRALKHMQLVLQAEHCLLEEKY